MKKLIGILLAACLLLPLTVCAAGVGTANRISFSQAGTKTETVDPDLDRTAYLAEKKEAFSSMLNRYASLENLTVEDWESLFTGDTYALWENVFFEKTVLDASDDAILIGDEDDWENMMVVSGTATRVTYWKAEYTLVTLRDAQPTRQIDQVTLTVTPPPAGSSTASLAPQVKAEGEGFTLAVSTWLMSPNMYTSDDFFIEFQEGETYYIYLMLKAEEGFTFSRNGETAGGIDEGFVGFDGCQVQGGEAIFAGSRTLNDGFDYLRVKLAVVAGGADSGSLPGDVDSSGKVDSTDARLVLQLAVGKIKETDLKIPAAADVDGSGRADSTDARLILQFAVNKINSFPRAG